MKSKDYIVQLITKMPIMYKWKKWKKCYNDNPLSNLCWRWENFKSTHL